MTGPLAMAVIGHVNHGKTALVRALTGIETDRLPEEAARGMSIALGFAWREYDGGPVDFIDAPGHEDFIRAMVAGVTGARAMLLVVSAVEGFGRQTREHLQIAGLLGLGSGVVAVTKADRLPEGDEHAVRAEVAARLAGGPLAGAPIVFCSAVTGQGLAAIHQAVADLQQAGAPPVALAGAFLPIDRVFTLAGAGAVVTGTLQGGALRSGGEAVLQPSGRRVGLRQIQIHGVEVDGAEPGGRVAVSLRGVSAQDVRAGDVLCGADAFRAAMQVDAVIEVSPDAPGALKHMDELRVLWGAGRDVATVRLIGRRALAPGERGLAQLQFPALVIAFAGQRAVLRRLSPAATVGGALILDPVAAPLRGKAAARQGVLEAALAGDERRIADALAGSQAGVVSVAEVSRLARRSEAEVRRRLADGFEALDADGLAAREAVAGARAAYVAELTDAHRRAPARPAVAVGAIRSALARLAPREIVGHVERALAVDGAIRLDGSLVALPAHDPFAALPAAKLARCEAIEADLRAGGATPPDPARLTGPDGEDRDLLDLLVESGRAVALRNVALRQTVVFHAEAMAVSLGILDAAFPGGAAFTTGEARATLATSRKFIVPLLEHFDSLGVTRHEGDVRRVAGRLAGGAGPGANDS